jgi:hypothetical protein
MADMCVVKPAENDVPTKNLTVVRLDGAESVLQFTQKNPSEWYIISMVISRKIEWTEDEAFCAKMATNEIQFFDAKNFGKVALLLTLTLREYNQD